MADPAETDSLFRDEREAGNLKGSQGDLLELDIESIPSPTLARLIEEVRNEAAVGRAYNRSYHRHNR